MHFLTCTIQYISLYISPNFLKSPSMKSTATYTYYTKYKCHLCDDLCVYNVCHWQMCVCVFLCVNPTSSHRDLPKYIGSAALLVQAMPKSLGRDGLLLAKNNVTVSVREIFGIENSSPEFHTISWEAKKNKCKNLR